MARNKRKFRRNVYDAAFAQVYWTRRNLERFEAGDSNTMRMLAEHMRISQGADLKAVEVGISEAELEHIHGHAAIDALLKISNEGGYHYEEYYVVAERDPAGSQNSYLIASQPGDAPADIQDGKSYAWFQLTEAEALVHCYFKVPIAHQEALLIVMQLVAKEQLGNYGAISRKPSNSQ
jgi:hypothetical protein